MTRHLFLVDGVRHLGDTRNLIRSVDNHILAKFPGSKTVWIAHPDQVPDLQHREIIGTTSSSESCSSLVTNWIEHASQNGAAGCAFHVLSYNSAVLTAAAALNGVDRFVATEHLGSFRESAHGSGPFEPRLVAPSPQISNVDLIRLMKQVLRDGGHTSSATAMHQPQLRLAMARVDPRARKNPSNPATFNIIGPMVAQGQIEGWLCQERRGRTGYEFVWLNEAPIAPSASPPTTAHPHEPIVEGATEPKARSRPRVMEDVLFSERIGSPPIPRKHLFAATEALIAENREHPLTVPELQNRVCTHAKQEALAVGYSKDQNWSAIGECLFRAMVQAGVLLKPDGTKVPAGIGLHSSKVGSLLPNFRQLTEALMLERIIQHLGDVHLSETYLLGLTLYQQGRENAVSRESLLSKVDELLGLLQEGGRIQVTAIDLITVTLN